MSLHTLANHLQSAGRGEDKVLVHMTPGEVNGLQSLAMAHGGSLSINPQTGLPEAGFLKSLLPMAIGFGLAPFTGGLSAALITGAGYTAATGSLKKGIMAGLGAYGGAGLAGGLSAMGAQGAAGVGAGLTPTTAGVGLNAGTSNAANVFANTADDVALANYRTFGANAGGAGSGIGLNTGFANQGLQLNAMGTPTAAGMTPSVTNASAYSPTNTGTPAYAQTPYVTQTGEGYRVMNVTDTPMREAYSALNPPPMPQMPPGATGYVFDPVKGGYNYYGPSGNPVMTPSAASGYVPSTATTSQPFGGGIQGQYAGPSGAIQTPPSAFSDRMSQLGRGAKTSFSSMEGLKGLYNAMPQGSVIASGLTLAEAMKPKPLEEKKDKSLIRPYDFEYNPTGVASEPYSGSGERLYFNPTFTARTPYEAPGPEYAAAGGLMGYAVGGPVEQMSALNAVGANTGYPMANIDTPLYANPMQQQPEATNVLAPSADAGVGTYTGEPRFARGGISHLGDYSDGGRLLKGPGDGVSDSIPASIGNRQPARLADGEFVVPARIVSEIGNGSTEAGARKLYAMMDRVQRARRKTTGKGRVAVNTKSEKLLPA
jgi:hypothetical protein